MAGDETILARLEALQARVDELDDRESIRNLIAAYGPLADSGDAAGAASIWQEDGVYAVDGFGDNRGQEAIAQLITAPHHQQMMQRGCAHLLGPAHIEISADTAIAVGYSVVFLRGSSGFEVYRVSANRWEFLKRDGAWRAQRRRNRLLDGNEAARALLALQHPLSPAEP
jgi:uncharacterized protein (TIGR02246 family)